jgi:hypothetical protein
MRSLQNGRTTHPVSIGDMSPRGFYLLLGKRKLFLSFAQFPWFREFTLRELTGVRRPSPQHLRWPEFDIDLDVDAIEHPERYPLRERRLLGHPAAVVARLRLERDSAPRRVAKTG